MTSSTTVANPDTDTDTMRERVRILVARMWRIARGYHPHCGACGACANHLPLEEMPMAVVMHNVLDHWDLLEAIHKTGGDPVKLQELNARLGGDV